MLTDKNALKGTHVAFFIPEWTGLTSPIVRTQVIGISNVITRLGAKSLVVGTAADVLGGGIEELSQERTLLFRPITTSTGAIGLLLRCFFVALKARRSLRNLGVSHIYVRSAFSAVAAAVILRSASTRIVFDVRAFASLEVRGRGRFMKSLVLKLFETIALRSSDTVITVSTFLQAMIAKRGYHRDVHSIPSCVDTLKFCINTNRRDSLRNEFGFTPRSIVICYSGGDDHWQRVGDIISLFEKLHHADQNFRLLIITQSAVSISKKIALANIPDSIVKIVSARPDDVPSFLSAADVAIILRSNEPLNSASSPIKVGEYLACGLPLIFSPWIGDLDHIFSRESDIGCRFDDISTDIKYMIDFCRNAKSPDSRRNARHLAEERFDRWRYRSAYIDTFRVRTH